MVINWCFSMQFCTDLLCSSLLVGLHLLSCHHVVILSYMCSNIMLYIQCYNDNSKVVYCSDRILFIISSSRCDVYNGQVMNACEGWSMWCLYSVRPTWRHQYSCNLSTNWIASQGEDHLHWAESVHQNCVIGRCAHLHICIWLHKFYFYPRI